MYIKEVYKHGSIKKCTKRGSITCSSYKIILLSYYNMLQRQDLSYVTLHLELICCLIMTHKCCTKPLIITRMEDTRFLTSQRCWTFIVFAIMNYVPIYFRLTITYWWLNTHIQQKIYSQQCVHISDWSKNKYNKAATFFNSYCLVSLSQDLRINIILPCAITTEVFSRSYFKIWLCKLCVIYISECMNNIIILHA